MTPFIYWKEPGKKEIFSILNPNVKILRSPGLSDSGFILLPFKKNDPGFIFQGEIDMVKNISIPAIKGKRVIVKNSGDHGAYMNLTKRAIRDIKGGLLKKVVAARSVKQSLPDQFNLKDFFIRLCSTYDNALVYMLGIEGEVWIGASPEILLKKEGNGFLTYALAGTKPPDSGKTFGYKEKSEQALVKDYVLKILANSGAKSVVVSELKEFNTGNLTHLVNEITFDSHDPLAVIQQLHPTPAVCGHPLDASLQFIHEYENLNRQYYSGYLGPVHGNTDFSLWVNLRCAKISGDSITLFAGAGIVADSDAESEWLETERKMDTLRELLTTSI